MIQKLITVLSAVVYEWSGQFEEHRTRNEPLEEWGNRRWEIHGHEF
jgi:hypothetical protein